MRDARRTAAAAVLLAVLPLLLGMGAGRQKQAKGSGLTSVEEQLAVQVGFDREAVLLVRETAREPLHRLNGYDENRYQIVANGLYVQVPGDRSDRVLGALRHRLQPLRYQAFLIEENDVTKANKIGILKGTDHYDILRVMQTNGDEYDILNADVIERLQDWEKRYSFAIIGAENSWVEIEFRPVPQDLGPIVSDVEDFCPDVIDEEFGTAEELMKDIRATRRLTLWWDR